MKHSMRIMIVALSLCVRSSVMAADDSRAVTADDFVVDNSVIPQIIEDINGIKKGGSIEIHQFVFSDKNFASPLVGAAERGAQVKLVLSPKFKNNKESLRILKKLRDAGIDDISYEDTHEKTVVMRSTSRSKYVAWSGSRNLSNKAYFQPEIMQRITDQSAIKKIVEIWHRREAGKVPVQTFTSPERPKKGSKRKFDTPPMNKAAVFASEVLSPSSVISGVLGFLRPTPPDNKKTRRTSASSSKSPRSPKVAKRMLAIAIMNVNNDPRGTRPRADLLEEVALAADEHKQSEFRILLDHKSAQKEKLVEPLNLLASLSNVKVFVHDQSEEGGIGVMEKIAHQKVIAVADPHNQDRSFVGVSTGNPTREGGDEPNITTVTRLKSPEALKFVLKLQKSASATPWQSPDQKSARGKKRKAAR